MSWIDEEPVRGGFPDPSLLALPGLDRMHAGERRQMVPPPTYHLFGLVPVSNSSSSSTFSMPCSPWLQTDAGVFFAGTAALVADAALGSAVLVGLGPGKLAVTSDLSLNFLRPVGTASKRLIARARPIEVGRSLGLAEGLVEDAHGRIVAHSTTRCFIMTYEHPELDGDPPTVEWPSYPGPDPHERDLPAGMVDPDAYNQMDFAQIMEQRLAGERPPAPFAEFFGMRDPSFGEGTFSCTVPASPWFASPAATVYGGILAYIVDTVLAGAFSTTLARDEVAAALDLKVQFLRPVWPDGRALDATAEVVHRGKGFAAAQGRITNADGKTVVLANSSAAIKKGRSWSSFNVADEAAALPSD